MRPHPRVGRVLVALCILLTIAGCTAQDGTGPLDGEGGRILGEAMVNAATGGTVTVARPDDVLAGTALAIPPGALVADLTIRLRTGPMPAVSGVVGEALVIEPVDTSLALPATLTLVYSDTDVPAGSDAGALALLHVTPAGVQTLVPNGVVDTVTHTVQGDTSALGAFVLVSRPRPR